MGRSARAPRARDRRRTGGGDAGRGRALCAQRADAQGGGGARIIVAPAKAGAAGSSALCRWRPRLRGDDGSFSSPSGTARPFFSITGTRVRVKRKERAERIGEA